MADHSPAVIRIGGPVTRACLRGLIAVASLEGASLVDYGGPVATYEALENAFTEGCVVTLYNDQASGGTFDALETFLVGYGVHFDRHSDGFYEYNAENVYGRGGEEPLALAADQAGRILLRWEDVLGIIEDTALDDHERLERIRGLVVCPETEDLAPLRFV
jgi:hypothetical protein